jgi:chlorobactene glucosyltransferase
LKNKSIDYSATYQSISILIPVRNEAHNIPTLLPQLLKLDYPNFNYDITLYDDGSTDGTADAIKKYQSESDKIKYIKGKELPLGWLGKSYACYELAKTSKSDYFLFIDADVILKKPALISALAYMQKYDLTLLSIFPTQITKTLGERMVVPMMYYILLTLLPLRAILKFKFPSLAGANGQFMLFNAKDYKQYQWHEMVKNQITEDIAIQTQVKINGLKTLTLLGNNIVSCRMYQGLSDSISGFSKNIFAGFGFNLIPFLLINLLEASGLFILLFSQSKLFEISLVLIIAIRLGLSFLEKKSSEFKYQLLLHPFMMFFKFYISMRSVYLHYTKTNQWKGRRLDI